MDDESPRTNEPAETDGIVIPFQELSPEALTGVIDEFVTREGTEYGEHDVDLQGKRDAVLRQLQRGEVKVLFDPKTETTNIVPVDDHGRLRRR